MLGFRFNLADAILGTFVVDGDEEYPPAGLLYPDFIATILLPCDPTLDTEIKKFTGNDDVGLPPIDGMTMALHSFTHYIILLSRSNLVLCDLQGESSSKPLAVPRR